MFTIVKRRKLNPTVTELCIHAPLIAKKAKAGQFIIVRAKEDSERIPLTIAGFDREAGTVSIIFQVVGAGTMQLNSLKEGEAVHDFVGPFGQGDVAMDAARCAKRLGAENVYIVYRRGMAELPARKEEVEHAEEEGIVFKTLTNPTEVLGDENGWGKGITCVEMELGEPDASGCRRPIVKEGSEFVLDVDTMIMALGTSPNPLIRSTTPGLDADKHGCLITNGPDGLTSRPMVYAGGDAVTGAATVILAMGAGKEAARAIEAAIKATEQ